MTLGMFCWLVSADVFMEGAGCRTLQTIYLIEWGKSYWEGNSLAETSNDEKPAVRRGGLGNKEQEGGNVAIPTDRNVIIPSVTLCFICFCVWFLYHPVNYTNYLRILFNIYYIVDTQENCLINWWTLKWINKKLTQITIFVGKITVFSNTEKKFKWQLHIFWNLFNF